MVSFTSTKLVVRTPAQAAGLVSLTVLNPDGYGVQLPNAYTYRAPAPMVTTVAPIKGPASGSTDVTIDGTASRLASASRSTTSWRRWCRRRRRASWSACPAHAPGAVDIVVTNPDSQQATRVGGYTYVAGGPAITQVLPPAGPDGRRQHDRDSRQRFRRFDGLDRRGQRRGAHAGRRHDDGQGAGAWCRDGERHGAGTATGCP